MLALRKCKPGSVSAEFQGCLEQDGNGWQYFLRKILNEISEKIKSGTLHSWNGENFPKKLDQMGLLCHESLLKTS